MNIGTMSIEAVLIFIRDNVESAERNGKRSLSIKCVDSSSANQMVAAFRRLYTNVGDVEFHFLNTDKWAYPKFEDSTDREDALELINKLKRGETVTINTVNTSVGQGGVNSEPTTTTVDSKEDSEDKTDWTTYIIIGAVAAIIIILLLPWKRK